RFCARWAPVIPSLYTGRLPLAKINERRFVLGNVALARQSSIKSCAPVAIEGRSDGHGFLEEYKKSCECIGQVYFAKSPILSMLTVDFYSHCWCYLRIIQSRRPQKERATYRKI